MERAETGSSLPLVAWGLLGLLAFAAPVGATDPDSAPAPAPAPDSAPAPAPAHAPDSALAPAPAADAVPPHVVEQVTELRREESAAPLLLVSRSEIDALPLDTPVAWGSRPTSPDGPRIAIASPTDNATYEGPFPIKVEFLPGPGGHPVDIETLRLEYKKAWGIDITDRVRDYVVGTAIDVEESELPTGRHTVEIEIADVEDQLSRRVFTVTVK